MISIPCKRALGVQYSKSFSKYIQNVYQKDPADYAAELKELDDLRQDCVVATIASTEGIAKLARYLGQLQQMPEKFPVSEDGIKINYSWINFTGKDKKPGIHIILIILSS